MATVTVTVGTSVREGRVRSVPSSLLLPRGRRSVRGAGVSVSFGLPWSTRPTRTGVTPCPGPDPSQGSKLETSERGPHSPDFSLVSFLSLYRTNKHKHWFVGEGSGSKYRSKSEHIKSVTFKEHVWVSFLIFFKKTNFYYTYTTYFSCP